MSYRVRVIYTSGAVQDIKCDNFRLTYRADGSVSEAHWENATPRPILLGVTNIAAVYEL